MSAELIAQLHQRGVFKLGEYVLKSGQKSPIYIDLRELITSIKILRMAALALCDIIKKNNVQYDYIVGVPYAALPIATLVCDILDAPMLLRRKEAKSYGTKKLIEGKFEAGKRALIVEDVVTSGQSIYETVEILRKEGLVCTDVVSVLDRQQGGVDQLKKQDINLISVITMSDILDYMISINEITAQRKTEIIDQLATPFIATGAENGIPTDWRIQSRYETTQNALNRRIMEIILKKETNLCLAADYTSTEEILKIADLAGPHICALKLHADIIKDFSPSFVKTLATLAESNDFVVFEDRKFADTGKTMELQISEGAHTISSWAQMVTVHSTPGAASIKPFKQFVGKEGSKLLGCLLIAELSTEGTLTKDDNYKKGTVKMAQDNKDVVAGFICQKRVASDPTFLYWTPGVNLDASTDGSGQQWRTIHQAIVEEKNDVIIVGRAITGHADPVAQLKRYKEAGMEALVARDN
ncbi:hypothetical protein QR680_005472 [Steinernema hermaphroditum]|uniref:Uridine 5'-monophosphate synthase n=1 Tax=Steinernema hermaphroditum TaxID=289476 RepID=A0AA39HUD2_9BILA|nr:hypothetical protein QR680_005472 [Steinernema hermaphroditum]